MPGSLGTWTRAAWVDAVHWPASGASTDDHCSANQPNHSCRERSTVSSTASAAFPRVLALVIGYRRTKHGSPTMATPSGRRDSKVCKVHVVHPPPRWSVSSRPSHPNQITPSPRSFRSSNRSIRDSSPASRRTRNERAPKASPALRSDVLSPTMMSCGCGVPEESPFHRSRMVPNPAGARSR